MLVAEGWAGRSGQYRGANKGEWRQQDRHAVKYAWDMEDGQAFRMVGLHLRRAAAMTAVKAAMMTNVNRMFASYTNGRNDRLTRQLGWCAVL